MTILKAAPEGGSALLSGLYDTKTLTGLSENISMQRLLYLTETLQGTRAALPDSFQPRTDVELCLLRLCDESLCGDPTALSARLDRVCRGGWKDGVLTLWVKDEFTKSMVGGASILEELGRLASAPGVPGALRGSRWGRRPLPRPAARPGGGARQTNGRSAGVQPAV